jgi:hypothetical protein
MKTLIALALLLPTLALAETTDPLRDKFIEAVRANGCQMTEDEAEVKLPPLGLQKKDVQGMIPDLIAEGVIELDEKKFNLILHAEGCPEVPAKGATP